MKMTSPSPGENLLHFEYHISMVAIKISILKYLRNVYHTRRYTTYNKMPKIAN